MEQGRPVAGQLGEAGQQAAEQLKESAQPNAQKDGSGRPPRMPRRRWPATQSAASDVTGQARQAGRQVRDQG